MSSSDLTAVLAALAESQRNLTAAAAVLAGAAAPEEAPSGPTATPEAPPAAPTAVIEQAISTAPRFDRARLATGNLPPMNELRTAGRKVLNHYLAAAADDGTFAVDHEADAVAIGVDRSTISKTLRPLARARYIVRLDGTTVARLDSGTYRLQVPPVLLVPPERPRVRVDVKALGSPTRTWHYGEGAGTKTHPCDHCDERISPGQPQYVYEWRAGTRPDGGRRGYTIWREHEACALGAGRPACWESETKAAG